MLRSSSLLDEVVALRKRRGQALVEFAMASVIFFFLLFATVQFFLILQTKTAVEAAANHASREAALHPIPQSCSAATEAARTAFEEFMRDHGLVHGSQAGLGYSLDLDCSPHEPVPIGGFLMFPFELRLVYPVQLIFPIGTSSITLKVTLPGVSEHIQRQNSP